MWLTIANIDSRDPTLYVHYSGHYCWVGTTKNSSIVSRPSSCERAECGHKTAIRFLSILVMFISSIHVVLLPFNFPPSCPPLLHTFGSSSCFVMLMELSWVFTGWTNFASQPPSQLSCGPCGSGKLATEVKHEQQKNRKLESLKWCNVRYLRWQMMHETYNDVMWGIWDDKWCMRLTWPVCGHESI